MKPKSYGLLAALLIVIGTPAIAQEESAGEGAAVLTAADADALRPGQFEWHPELATEGAIRIEVGLLDQVVYVYRGGTLIGVSTVSSGRDGHPTPQGRFPIIEKAVMHKSTLYSAAPMPYMQRLTMDGVALHAGVVPGRRSSHGCVHLPAAFAEALFSVTHRGDVVDIGLAAPVDPEPALPVIAVAPDKVAIDTLSLRAETIDAPSGKAPARGWKRMLPTMLASL